MVYLDHNATTSVDPRVLDAMVGVYRDAPGNPSSSHRLGQDARRRLEEARERVANALDCKPNQVVFVASGTESDNLAIIGAVRAIVRLNAPPEVKPLVITSAIEHPAVREAVRELVRRGEADHTMLPVDNTGRVNVVHLRDALATARESDTPVAVVSIMTANNEVGVLQPIAELADACAEFGVPMHSDTVQAIGKVDLSPLLPKLAAYALAPHKYHGPKGVGVLVRDAVKLPLAPLMFGGGQEAGLRPATENVALAMGTAVATELAIARVDEYRAHVIPMREKLLATLREVCPALIVNTPLDADNAMALPNTLNVALPGLNGGGEHAVAALDQQGICISAGSACHSGAIHTSDTLVAMGLDPAVAACALRFSFGFSITAQQLADALPRIQSTLRHLMR